MVSRVALIVRADVILACAVVLANPAVIVERAARDGVWAARLAWGRERNLALEAVVLSE